MDKTIAQEERMKRLIKVAEVFSPGAPIDKQALFSGRVQQVSDVINAVAQRGQHVILFGERGVGKTSLANVISEIMKTHGLKDINSGIINCDGTDDFSSLWHKVLRELTFPVQKSSIGFNPEIVTQYITLDNLVPSDITPDTIRYLIQRSVGRAIIIIDEVDRIKDEQTTVLLADTIKTLSDHSVDTTIILVGVADSVDNLISKHASIERSLVQVQMPRMSLDELREIMTKGLNLLNMSIDKRVEIEIAYLSQGLPHYTHLLSLHAAQSAISHDRDSITGQDLQNAIAMGVRKAQRSIINAYHEAILSARETLYSEVLLACALASTDDMGFFAATDVRQPMSAIKNKNYEISAFSPHMNDFCEIKRGPILQRKGSPRSYRFRFINPLMQPYIVMRGLSEGLITSDIFEQTQVN
ncbi:ATP-binding protein [Nostoc sp. DedQUE07]|uniref:ATP-binding protein n=1 Tax=Nostoc sp. DedQUE07 TaxID=3075392 RepID=UPI002AD2B006|nr:ATP-binding protein [Nostoc sp. DedQUE07]MDZ8131922.1 ATP-binding protein [Nostoc sp. DedQUE07]